VQHPRSSRRGRHKWGPALALVAALALLGAGCGDDEDEGEPAAEATTEETATEEATTEAEASGGGETIELSMTDFAFEPANPTVAPGTVTIVATNDGQAPHNVEVEGPSGEAELEEDLGPGESDELEVDLNEPGTYVWYCPVGDHRDQGMEGEITVEG
jgi:plastocyanin